MLGGLFAIFLSATALQVTIRNDIPRTDLSGNIVNAHDGSVVRFNKTFFMYGTVYEDCNQGGPQCNPPCGYSPNTFALYTSPDLMAWTLQSKDILPEVDKDNSVQNYWMPDVAYNALTGSYVMQYWSTHCGFSQPCMPLAASSTPYGPFKEITPAALHGGTPSSQAGWFIDMDGSAYAKYNTIPPDQHHVMEKLSPDWLTSTGDYATIFFKPTLPWMEGGGMFRRGDLYYYMTGSDCCFCSWGADARYWTARRPLGPWHPGIAPPLPTSPCNLTGTWTSAGELGNETFTLNMPTSLKEFDFVDQNGHASGSVDQKTGYVTFPPSAGDHRGVLTGADGRDAGCERVRWYGYESFVWCREGSRCTLPTYHDPPEVNFCADGKEPAQNVRVNPCAPDDPTGTNFTVPSQQFNVILVDLEGGQDTAVLYYGERSMSAPDGLKSHNYQAWVPLEFAEDGSIKPMSFADQFSLNIEP